MTPPLGLGIVRDLAWREIRAGTRGFRLFVACLVLGVGIIAGIGSIGAASLAGIAADARALLGGDLEIRIPQRQATPEEMAALAALGRVSHVAEMRAMARPESGGLPALVEVKAVDSLYPLYGRLLVSPSRAMADALARQADGAHGAIAHSLLLRRAGLKVGDRLLLGEVILSITAAIEREPDSTNQVFALGPHLIVRHDALAASGLALPGSIISHQYRIALPRGADARAIGRSLAGRFPQAGWRIRQVEDAGQGLRRFLENTRAYLDLIGLSALLIGGLGIANAVRAHLEAKARSIAILRCLGATKGQVIALHLAVIAAMGLPSVAAGIALGAGLPLALKNVLGDYGVSVLPGLYPVPLFRAALFGALTALVFSLPALFRAGRTRPAQLLRAATIEIDGGLARDRWSIGATGLILAGAVVALTDNHGLALFYCLAAGVTLAAFRVLALAIQVLARRIRERTRAGTRAFRFALSAISRPGAPVGSIVLSIGLGLTVLVAVVLIQGSVRADLERNIPDKAPSFYFIDIQPSQIGAFERLVKAQEGASEYQSVPMLRGRITRLGSIEADKITPPAELAWVLRGDRGITWSARPPAGAEIVAGEWWPEDYQGPPLISLDAETAEGFGLDLGDTITINVLGREITGTIANLRRIDWSSLSINFVMVFSPGMLEQAPQTSIATLRVPAEGEPAMLDRVTAEFPNISALRVSDALAAIGEIMTKIATAMRLSALATLAAGMLVLAGAIATGNERRHYEAVLLKMLGGTRADVLFGYLWEYTLLAAISAFLALGLGALGAGLFLSLVLESSLSVDPIPVAMVVMLALTLALGIGFLGSWRVLGARAASYLRNE